MTVEISREWDGNVCEREGADGRITAAPMGWRWVVTVDGAARGDFDSKAEAEAYVQAVCLYHIRVGVKRASRQIMGSRGNPGRTLCGAPLTDHDATVREARAIVSKGWRSPARARCVACFAALLKLDFAAARRVED